MRPFFFLVLTCLCLDASSQTVQDWTLLIPPSDFDYGLNQDENLYDRNEQKIYFRNTDAGILGYVDLNTNTIENIPSAGWFGRMDEMVLDPVNNILYGWRAGKSTVYSIPTTGGTWTAVSPSSYDGSHYHGQCYWNPINEGVGFFGGYGGFSMKNSIHEIPSMTGNWTQKRGNTSTGNPPRAWCWMSLNETGDELYIYGQHGNINGSQYQYPLTIIDGSNYNWARGLWKINLTDYSISTLIPLDDPTVLQYTDIAFDFINNRLFVSGGSLLNASSTNTNQGVTTNITQYYDLNNPNGFELHEVGTAYPAEGGALWFDGTNNRLLHYGGSGLWALPLNPPAPIEGCADTSACNYDVLATLDDGNCTYPEYGRDCAGECLGGTSWYVDDAAADGAGTGELLNPFSTVQEALESACPGDMVLISPGTYIENVNLTADDVTVKGYAPSLPIDSVAAHVIIDGAELATAFYTSGDNTQLSDITIQNGKSPYGAGLYLAGANGTTVSRCIIRDNVGTGDITAHGIAVNSSNCLIEDCLITGNYGRKHTVNVNNSGHVIRNCRIVNNPTWEEGGGIVVYAPGTLIENCLIAGNSNGGITTHRTGVIVDHCTIANNTGHGCFVWCTNGDADLNVSNSIIANNGNTEFKMSQTGIRVATARMRNTLVEGGTDYDWQSVYKVFDIDSTLITDAPLLDDDFSLLSLSPAIGTGTAMRYAADGTLSESSSSEDLNGSARPLPAGTDSDLGCFESALGEPEPSLGCNDPVACNYDASANENDGSCEYAPNNDCSGNCPVWPEDTVLQCLGGSTLLNAGIERGTFFDGQDDWILMSESGVTGTNPMTISFWALTTHNGAMDIFTQACDNDCWADIRCGMNTPQCGLVGPSFKSPSHFATFPFDVDDGNWHHYTYVFGDGSYSFSNLKIYVDGQLFSASTTDGFCGHNWGGWTYNAEDLPIRIGKGLPLGGMFRGYLDDLALWGEVLSQSDVNLLVQNGPAEVGSQLMSFWPLDELNDGFFEDVIGNNDGAPIGGIGDNPAPSAGVVTWFNGSQMPTLQVFPNQTTSYSAQMVLSTGQVCNDTVVVEVLDEFNSDVNDNGICDLLEGEGCTDPNACNFNEYSSEDDGSCDYTCCPGPGCCEDESQWNPSTGQCTDFDPDTVIVTQIDTLIVQLTDTLIILDTLIQQVPACGEGTIWNPVAQECIVAIPADLNWDGCITTNDLLDFLPEHGHCPPLPEWPGYPEEEAFSSCACDYEESVNYHGYDYDIVAIGNQCWFAENLRTQSYRDGTPIPFAGLNADWSAAHQSGTGSWCYPNGDPVKASYYGLMYNHWLIMNGIDEVCPSGWHVPSDSEFLELEMYMGMPLDTALLTDWRGTDEGTRLKAAPSDSPGWNGTNEVGFGWVQGGWRHVSGSYGYIDHLGLLMFKPSSISEGNAFGIRQAGNNSGGLVRSFGGNAGDGRSLRCIKD